jgi:hypothetical protein
MLRAGWRTSYDTEIRVSAQRRNSVGSAGPAEMYRMHKRDEELGRTMGEMTLAKVNVPAGIWSI